MGTNRPQTTEQAKINANESNIVKYSTTVGTCIDEEYTEKLANK